MSGVHIDDGSRARVARRGYLEFPSEFFEKLASDYCHKWFIREENGTLHFTRKSRPIFDEALVSIARQMVREKDPTYWLWILSHGAFQIHFPWGKKIPFEIHDLPNAQIEMDSFTYVSSPSPCERKKPQEESRLKRGFKSIVRKLVAMTTSARYGRGG